MRIIVIIFCHHSAHDDAVVGGGFSMELMMILFQLLLPLPMMGVQI